MRDRPGANPFDSADGIVGVPIFDPTVVDGAGRIDSRATYSKLIQNLEWWSGQGVVRR